MRQRRSGFSSMEIVLGILLFGVLFVGMVAWRAYTWARPDTAGSREVRDVRNGAGGDTVRVKQQPPDDLQAR